MKATIGSTTITLDANVLLLDAERRTPIYHRAGASGREGCSWTINRTRCGRVWFSRRDDEDGEQHGTWFPSRHAVRIARPCVICWPELRRQEPLFTDQRRRPRPPAVDQLEATP